MEHIAVPVRGMKGSISPSAVWLLVPGGAPGFHHRFVLSTDAQLNSLQKNVTLKSKAKWKDN